MPVGSVTAVDPVVGGLGHGVVSREPSGGPSLRTGDANFWARTHLAGELDLDGARMKSLLATFANQPVGTRVDLDFVPTPESLRALAYLGRDTTALQAFEVFLGRRKSDGGWFAVRGDLHGVKADASGCDVAIHNHVDVPLAYTTYPSPNDLISSAGLEGRFLVVSVDGLVEWSSDISFPDEPERKLTPEEDADEWFRQLHRGFRRKLVMKLTFPTGYPSLLESIGVRATKTRWREVTQDLVTG